PESNQVAGRPGVQRRAPATWLPVLAAGSAAPAVGDGRSPVAPERLGAEPDAGRGLAALVLGAVDQGNGALHDVRVEAVRRQLLERAVLLHVGGEHLVELRVRRQRVLVELVVTELGARRTVDD